MTMERIRMKVLVLHGPRTRKNKDEVKASDKAINAAKKLRQRLIDNGWLYAMSRMSEQAKLLDIFERRHWDYVDDLDYLLAVMKKHKDEEAKTFKATHGLPYVTGTRQFIERADWIRRRRKEQGYEAPTEWVTIEVKGKNGKTLYRKVKKEARP
jgi:hypothetical protein